MSQKVGKNNNKVYRLVLTGGPCGGKTTGQARLCTFFENLGWKVYRVPETATVLMGGGVKWTDLNGDETIRFQENLLKTMMQIENSFFDLAATCSQNCLVICDRGTMDASAYLQAGQWDPMKKANNWNEVDLRDSRYNQVIHMVSAAKGAEAFYCTDQHVVRHEGIGLARQLDDLTSQAWVGHPYYDVIDNSTGFEKKIVRMIAAVCNRLGIDAGDRLSLDSKKRKFLVRALPNESTFPQFQDFIVVHDYLVTPNQKMQARIRRRGQNVRWDSSKGRWDLETDNKIDNKNRIHISMVLLNADLEVAYAASSARKAYLCGTDIDFSNWTYTHTIRRPEINKESPELKMQISSREYENLLRAPRHWKRLLVAQKDGDHYTIYKKRRCFLWNDQYFQLDIYQEPCHPRCKGLIILETYTTMKGEELKLPDFLDIEKEVTDHSKYSMYNLSKRDKNLDVYIERRKKEELQAASHRIINGVVNETIDM